VSIYCWCPWPRVVLFLWSVWKIKDIFWGCTCVICFYSGFMCVYLRFLTLCGRLAGRVLISYSILASSCVLQFYLWRCFLLSWKWISCNVNVPQIWITNIYLVVMGARGSVVGWGTRLQAGRSPVRVPDEVDFFNIPNPSSRSMALGSTQPLTEMGTRNLAGGKKQPAHRTDNLAAICESNVWKCGGLYLSQS
jgi:hypothetical protein